LSDALWDKVQKQTGQAARLLWLRDVRQVTGKLCLLPVFKTHRAFQWLAATESTTVCCCSLGCCVLRSP